MYSAVKRARGSTVVSSRSVDGTRLSLAVTGDMGGCWFVAAMQWVRRALEGAAAATGPRRGRDGAETGPRRT